ncbi:transposase [Rhizobium dioscoreae]|uniref:transposase n=1 Tax=Rhizobium TaxID=379 RepID=UPI001260C143|nr:transposase [Rhizobium dioscoreae]
MKRPLKGGGRRQVIEGEEDLRNGRQRYDTASKVRLAAASLEPRVSVSRLTLDNGVNANLLRKLIKQVKEAGLEHRRLSRLRP